MLRAEWTGYLPLFELFEAAKVIDLEEIRIAVDEEGLQVAHFDAFHTRLIDVRFSRDRFDYYQFKKSFSIAINVDLALPWVRALAHSRALRFRLAFDKNVLSLTADDVTLSLPARLESSYSFESINITYDAQAVVEEKSLTQTLKAVLAKNPELIKVAISDRVRIAPAWPEGPDGEAASVKTRVTRGEATAYYRARSLAQFLLIASKLSDEITLELSTNAPISITTSSSARFNFLLAQYEKQNE